MLDLFASESAIQAFVASIVEDAEHAVLHAGLASGTGERLELLRGLLSELQPLPVRGELVRDLLPASLNGEILLREGDLRLSGIAFWAMR